MNKIAIFGDSFAARMHQQAFQSDTPYVKRMYKSVNRKYDVNEVNMLLDNWGKQYIPWMDYLDADVYGWMGSDLYYSYNQFIKHHEKYKKCIFVITGKYRYSSKISNNWKHCIGISEAERHIKHDSTVNKKSYYSYLLNFFKNIYFRDFERIELIHQAMINSILLTRPNTLLINVYPDLENVYKSELDSWNLTDDLSNYIDLRQCHMTKDNNLILGNYILTNLNIEGYLNLSPIQWKIPSMKEKDMYLIKIEKIFGKLL